MTPKRKRNSLSAVFVQSVQKAGTYSGRGGLNLRVEDSGTKYRFQRVTIDGKRRNLGPGGYPTVSLAEARKDALSNSRMIREGRDPLAEKREAIAARRCITGTCRRQWKKFGRQPRTRSPSWPLSSWR